MEFKLNVNGVERVVNVPPETPLLWVLREELSLTGTKYGCGIAQCGACTIHFNGAATRSCVIPVSAASSSAGVKITTIEGLSKDRSHRLQKAWIEKQVPQCGYCQSGMLMTAAALLASNRKPTEQQIAETMTNICRCGTYPRVKAAILSASQEL
jgi:isoquinoline 1-oxidoreductase subunit alpha